jgi:hypothetical protein
VVFVTLLLIVGHPELRAMLFVIDSIGVDLFLLLCVAHIRSYGPIVSTLGVMICGHLIFLASRSIAMLGWVGHVIVPSEGAWSAAYAMSTACIAVLLFVANGPPRLGAR